MLYISEIILYTFKPIDTGPAWNSYCQPTYDATYTAIGNSIIAHTIDYRSNINSNVHIQPVSNGTSYTDITVMCNDSENRFVQM